MAGKIRKGDRVTVLAGRDKGKTGDVLKIDNLLEAVKGKDQLKITAGSIEFVGKLDLSEREREILLTAGLLNYTRTKANG